jgi:hypothetical protein
MEDESGSMHLANITNIIDVPLLCIVFFTSSNLSMARRGDQRIDNTVHQGQSTREVTMAHHREKKHKGTFCVLKFKSQKHD